MYNRTLDKRDGRESETRTNVSQTCTYELRDLTAEYQLELRYVCQHYTIYTCTYCI